jgi:glycosyltransferase involved in cell wall biosynthesis
MIDASLQPGAGDAGPEPRILVCGPALDKTGGISSYLCAVLPHLKLPNDYLTTGSRILGEPFLRRLVRLLHDYTAFVRFLRTGKHRIILINTSMGKRPFPRDAVFLLLSRFFPARVVCLIHGWNPAFSRGLIRWLPRLLVLVLSQADSVSVLARDFADDLRRAGLKGRVRTFSAAISETLIKEGSDAAQARWRSPHPPASTNILFLSRIEKEKGIYESIESFRILQTKHANVSFRIAGDGTELAAAQAYVRRNAIANITFLGMVTGRNKSEALGTADIFFLPTWHEGMPISVLEAMAFGLPVVTRSVGALRDFFRTPEMGYTTDSFDPQLLSGLLEELVMDPSKRAAMGRYNQEYAARQFSASSVARELNALLDPGSAPTASA